MAGPSTPPDPRALSGAPLDLWGEELAEVEAFDHPEGDRYALGGRLGRGGMGEIRAVEDRRLGREVALKTSRRHAPEDEARLAREARMTARLSHPGIVPVLDAGRLADGRAAYTMPVLSGRSLADAAAAAPDPAARLRLVRAVLDATRAVAYAHSRGILHRDLKPENVLVGAFGETVVADWGLACTAAEGLQGGAAVGTPGFMSPEQAAGLPLDVRSDVFSLGALLDSVLAPLSEEERPPELAAIARRAARPEPAARYPDARALAADLEAWLDGRRVDAYAYTGLELTRRFVRAFRGPLVAGALGLFAVTIAAAVGVERVTEERNRAVDAERAAVEARDGAQAHLARALVAQALQAADAGDRASAELLAAHALNLEESALARGVLARFAGRPRPALLGRRPLPEGCDSAELSADGAGLLCTTRDAVLDLDPATGEERARLPLEAHGAAFSGLGGLRMIALDDRHYAVWRADGALRPIPPPETHLHPSAQLRAGVAVAEVAHRIQGGHLLLVDTVEATSAWGLQCPGDQRWAAAVDLSASGRLVTICSDGALQWAPLDDLERPVPITRLEVAGHTPNRLSLDPLSEHRAAISTAAGRITVVDLRDGSIERTLDFGPEAVRELRLHGDRLAAASQSGRVAVWDLPTGLPVLRVLSPATDLRWSDGGRVLRVASLGAVEDWRVPDPGRPHRLPSDSGASSVTLDPGGRWVASGHGDGVIRVRWVADGGEVVALQWSGGVVKDVHASPDGRRLLAGSAGDTGLRVYDTATWSHEASLTRWGYRRANWLTADRAVGSSYTPGVTVAGMRGFRDGGVGGVHTLDLEADPARAIVVGRDHHGRTWRAEGGDLREVTFLHTDLTTRAVAPLGPDTLMINAEHLHRFRPGAPTKVVPQPLSPGIDLLGSPDLRWYAIGHADGATSVWDAATDTPVAVLRGHGARVAGVAFSADGGWLYTASWDGDVRAWSLEPLTRAPASLLAEVERAWQRDLSDVLGQAEQGVAAP